MKSLERLEYASGVGGVEAFPIVRDGHSPKIAFHNAFNPDSRHDAFPAVLDSVSNQVLEHHYHLCAIGRQLRKGSGCDVGVAFPDVVLEI